MRKTDDSTIFVVTAVIMLVAAGYWAHTQVVAFAVFIGVDTPTAYTLLKRVAALAVVCGIFAYAGIFRKFAPYLLVGLFICALPVLDYWSASVPILYEEFGEKGNPKWYGQGWVQIVGALVLGAVGFFLSGRQD